MKNLIINNLYIEVTRNCTMNCAHCLRGEKEKINLNINDIDDLFSNNNNINIIKIKKLTITGGEPTLNPQVILEIIKKIISKQIDIEHFIMVINGSIYNQSLIDGLNTFYKYYRKKYHYYPNFYLICSQDQYHRSPKEETLNKYHKLPYFWSSRVTLSKDQILNVGRAYDNNLGNEESYKEIYFYFNLYKENNIPNIFIESNNLIKLDELYLSSKGLYSFHIIDVPFKQIDELCIYNINEITNIIRSNTISTEEILQKRKHQ